MRYFFDIRDDQLVPDEEGMILPELKRLKKRLRGRLPIL